MYYARKRDLQPEYLSIIKTALRNTVQIINFADPTWTRSEHEALMHDVNIEARYIGSKYSLQIDPLYFEWDTFIPTFEKDFLEIFGKILNHDNHRSASIQGQGQSIPAKNEEF